ncbi:FKBP-like protein [Paxillus ammoniavirescens]|nr:FKBP-like protein [Paxillus ammoniavirescens]
MVVAIAPWSIVINPGKEEVIVPQGDLQIKNAALPDVLTDGSGRTTVKLTYLNLASPDTDDEDDDDDEDAHPEGDAVTTVLCSLTPGKIEQSSCEIILEQDNEYILEVVGKNSIHLYGNYIDQAPVDQPPMGSDMDSDSEDEEDAFRLGEVSSDVEIEVDQHELDLEDDADRFEEVQGEEEEPKEPSAKNLKRPREDAMETDEGEEKLSKSQKKKLAKKLKTADGSAVPAPAEEKETKVEEKKEKKVEEKKDKKKDKKEKKEKGEKDTKEIEKKGEIRTLDGGVKVRDTKVGTGKMAKKGDKVDMRYIGKLSNGKVFDKNVKGKPFTFTLGRGDVIKGWDVGIAGMQIGGEREVTVPPSMGYGNKKLDDIPAGSTLIFEVKLLEIK